MPGRDAGLGELVPRLVPPGTPLPPPLPSWAGPVGGQGLFWLVISILLSIL